MESANDFDKIWKNTKDVYEALTACACEPSHIEDIHETRLQLATKLKQELHDYYSFNILISAANRLYPSEVHFSVKEKQGSVNVLNLFTCFPQ